MSVAEPCLQVTTRERSHRLLDAIENSSELVAMTDRTGTFTYANAAFLQKLCRPEEDGRGRHISSFI